MKKKFAVLLSFALSLTLLLGSLTTLKAATGEEYTYTVRIYGGNQGTYQGEDMIEITGLAYGDRFTFSLRDVQLNDDSKYYVRGLRESGKDNNTVNGLASFTVTEDQDYVVAYGFAW